MHSYPHMLYNHNFNYLLVLHIYTRLTQAYTKICKPHRNFIFSYKQQLMAARVLFLYVRFKIPFNPRLPAGGAKIYYTISCVERSQGQHDCLAYVYVLDNVYGYVFV